MQLNLNRLGLISLMGGTMLLAVACGDDKKDPKPADSGTDSGDQDSGSDSAVVETTLYERLGGHAGINAAVTAIVAAELADEDVAPFFATVGTEGHPTAAQLTACFVNLVGNAVGGPEAYPGVPADNEGFQCRSMSEAHEGLGITSSVFDKFVGIAAAKLGELGVSNADIASIAPALLATKGDIVEEASDAGTDAN